MTARLVGHTVGRKPVEVSKLDDVDGFYSTAMQLIGQDHGNLCQLWSRVAETAPFAKVTHSPSAARLIKAAAIRRQDFVEPATEETPFSIETRGAADVYVGMTVPVDWGNTTWEDGTPRMLPGIVDRIGEVDEPLNVFRTKRVLVIHPSDDGYWEWLDREELVS